jgi:hypothetical protein
MKVEDHHQPASFTNLFLSITLLALQGFGGLAAGAFLAG